MSDVRAEFFEDNGQTWLKAKIVGDPNTLIRKAKAEDAERWPMEWQAHQEQRDVDVGGTPLEDVPMLNKDIILHLKVKGIRNAEELAGMSDMAAGRVGMGAIDWRKAAQNMLDAQKNSPVKEPPKKKAKAE